MRTPALLEKTLLPLSADMSDVVTLDRPCPLQANGRAFAQIARFHPELTAFRRDLHAHPELGFEEIYTASRITYALKLCGVDVVHTGIGKTGVVAIVKGRRHDRASPPTASTSAQ